LHRHKKTELLTSLRKAGSAGAVCTGTETGRGLETVGFVTDFEVASTLN